MAYSWMMVDPELRLRTPARRCSKEFRQLFIQKFNDKYGEGLKVKPNKTRLKLEYHAASPSLRGIFDLIVPDLPDPFMLKGPLKKILAIAEECTDKLESYSRYLGRMGNEPGSVTALALLPTELAKEIPDTVREKHDPLLPKGIRDIGYGSSSFDVDGAWKWLSELS